MITLFYSSRACSLASHITLEEAGAPYATVRVDFAKSEQRQPEYLAIWINAACGLRCWMSHVPQQQKPLELRPG